jgi:hypothetical protein
MEEWWARPDETVKRRRARKRSGREGISPEQDVISSEDIRLRPGAVAATEK